MFTVPPTVQATRLSICRACSHFNNEWGTCGRPLVGRTLTKEEIKEIEADNTITRNRSKIKLCGCVMKIKTRLTFAECPIGKWDKHVNLSKAERREIMAFVTEVKERGHMKRSDVERLYGYGERVSGMKQEAQMCGRCVKDMIDKIYRTLKQDDESRI